MGEKKEKKKDKKEKKDKEKKEKKKKEEKATVRSAPDGSDNKLPIDSLLTESNNVLGETEKISTTYNIQIYSSYSALIFSEMYSRSEIILFIFSIFEPNLLTGIL